MKTVVLSALVALLVQFGTLPLLIGGRTAGEIIGWPMIMAIFFGVPSVIVYLLMFGGLQIVSPPPSLAILLGVSIPAAIVLGFLKFRGMPLDFSTKNWVLWMGMVGGFAGTITYLQLRPSS